MSALHIALEAHDLTNACDLIWRRLGGDHLDAPFDPSAGESPTDFLRLLFNAGQGKNLTQAFNLLLSDRVPTAIKDVAAQPGVAEAARLGEFLRLLEQIEYKDAEGLLTEACEQLMMLPREVELIAALQLIAFRTYVALDLEDHDRFHALFSPALDDPSLLPGYCVEAAKANPEIFLGPVARHLFPELVDGPRLVDTDLDYLAEAIRMAANELHYRWNTDKRLAVTFQSFFNYVAQAARTPNAPAIRAAVLKGLSRSSMPARFIRDFETAFWDAYPQPYAILSRCTNRAAFGNWLSGCLTAPDNLDHTIGLGINSIPYGEAGLIRLLSTVLSEGWGFRLHIVHDDYSKVGNSLSDGKLSLAIHNNALLRQLMVGETMRIPVLASPPLLTFRMYDVLVSQAALRASLANTLISEEARALAGKLLDGTELDSLRPSQAAVELMTQHGVYFLKDTDTQEIAFQATGATLADLEDHPRVISEVNPDQGLEQLLNGKVVLYFGGAIQSNYALKNCASRISRATRIRMETDLRFYIPKKAYEDPRRKATYDFILQAWNVTRNVWRILRHEERGPEDWLDARSALREEVMIEVNRAQNMPNGFVSSFDDLFELIQEHDRIHTMPNNARFEAPGDKASSNVVSFEKGRAA